MSTSDSPNSPSITWEKFTLRLRDPFGISYGVSETRDAYVVTLAGSEGRGEGTIPRYYGIEPEEMTGYWDAMGRRGRPFPEDAADIEAWIGGNGPAPARCAVSLALHDRIARRQGIPLHVLLELPPPGSLSTSYTIGLDEPAEMARKARMASEFSILKIKLGAGNELGRFRAVREARPDAELLVDANGAWTPEEAVGHVRAMAGLGLRLVEQPVAKGNVEGLGFVQARVDVPVVADESLQTVEDVEAITAAGVLGINVKLMKLGGLGPALRVIRRAQQLGRRIMLGCMVETSLGVTAVAHLSGLADWLDLDSPILISNDPFDGIQYGEGGQIILPDRSGIGIRLRDGVQTRTPD